MNYISCDKLVTEYPYVLHEILITVLPILTYNYSKIILNFFFKRGTFKNINITLNNKTTTNNLKNKKLKVRQK